MSNMYTNKQNLGFSALPHLRGAMGFILLLAAWSVVGGAALYFETDRAIFRWANGTHAPFGDVLFPLLTLMGTAGFMLLAFLVTLIAFKPLRTKAVILTAVVANLVPFLLVQLLKNVYNLPRPLHYFDHAAWIHTVAGQPVNLHYSFPSGHSEGVFAFFAFVSCLLPAGKSWMGIVFFAMAALTSYSRMYLAHHFYADVYAGSMIGGVSSLLVVFCFQVFRSGKA